MLNMSRELDAKDEVIQGLENRIHDSQSRILPSLNEELTQYKRDNQELGLENDMLKARITSVQQEYDRLVHQHMMPDPEVENLIRRISAELQDSRRDNERLSAQVRELLNDSESKYKKQKQEWSEIYANLKTECDGLKRDVRHLNQENEKLLRLFESQKNTLSPKAGSDQSVTSLGDKELAKRLKKRESECQALWDTLKDMQTVFDSNKMAELLAVRSLDSKAKRKLAI